MRLAAEHQREIEWRPILVWAVLRAHSIPTPMAPLAKRAYFDADIARAAAFHGVPFFAPRNFPVSSHHAARLSYALAEQDRSRARALGRYLLIAYFSENIDIAETSALTTIAARHGISREAAEGALGGEIGRRRLSEAIEGAVAAGVCGSPWFLFEGESFFGADRLPQIAWRFAGAAPR